MVWHTIKTKRDIAVFVAIGTAIALVATHVLAHEVLRLELVGRVLAATIICPLAIAPPMLFLIGRAAQQETLLRYKLSDALERDFLTQIYTRKYFFDRIGTMSNNAQLAILMIDIDHFKVINDTFGHIAGDRVIHAVAQTLSKTVRESDFIARFGGEEFVACLAGDDRDGALDLAQWFRKAVMETEIYEDNQRIKVALSIGVGLSRRGIAPIDAMTIADDALLEAKATGRNKVVFAQPDGTKNAA